MEDKASSGAEAYDDLTSLFLPDILHGAGAAETDYSVATSTSNPPRPTQTTNSAPPVASTRGESGSVNSSGPDSGIASGSGSGTGTGMGTAAGTGTSDNTSEFGYPAGFSVKLEDELGPIDSFPTSLRPDELSSFNTFINNNDFISNSSGGVTTTSSNFGLGSGNGGAFRGGVLPNGGSGGASSVPGVRSGTPLTSNDNNNANNNNNSGVMPGIGGGNNSYSPGTVAPPPPTGYNYPQQHPLHHQMMYSNTLSINQAQQQQPVQSQQQNPYINHYANYVPIEAAATAAMQQRQQRQHMASHPVPQSNMFNPDLTWYPNNQYEQSYLEKSYSSDLQSKFFPRVDREGYPVRNEYQSELPQSDQSANFQRSVGHQGQAHRAPSAQSQQPSQSEPTDSTPGKKHLKRKQEENAKYNKSGSMKKTSGSNVKASTSGTAVTGKKKYHLPSLTSLLDLKTVPVKNSVKYQILDRDDNNISINLSAFINGRFYTNEADNKNYYQFNSSPSDELGASKLADASNQPPKILSCYRRNFIQLSANLNLSGFKSSNTKMLKLQTSDFGYTVTRVIKCFKLEILANTNFSTAENVPMFVAEDKEKKPNTSAAVSQKNQDINPDPITSMEHIIGLTDNPDPNSREVDNYYTVKRLQFKSATPNNGKISFQNYYNIIVRLSAIVVDLYYDDYVDERSTSSDKNEIALFDLVSEPLIVRGRNPSFYEDRKDILIKGRDSNMKESFKNASKGSVSDKQTEASVAAVRSGGTTVSTTDDILEEEDDDEDDGDDDDDDEDRGKQSTGFIQPYGTTSDKPIPPLAYSATTSSLINLKSIMNGKPNKAATNTSINEEKNKLVDGEVNRRSLDNQPIALETKQENKRYKYFPISNVYYLPPISVVYFPHGAHGEEKIYSRRNSSVVEEDVSEKALSPPRRKSSNVYFK
ncbi:hypothetical protein CAAN1_17S02212 [[Candida] anglica]|uniref:NDT80 domain-containing protein n=1 Tax=[Candida] anglica TaxID=148631 RepID=A0ABP0E8P8_9ASCO